DRESTDSQLGNQAVAVHRLEKARSERLMDRDGATDHQGRQFIDRHRRHAQTAEHKPRRAQFLGNLCHPHYERFEVRDPCHHHPCYNEQHLQTARPVLLPSLSLNSVTRVDTGALVSHMMPHTPRSPERCDWNPHAATTRAAAITRAPRHEASSPSGRQTQSSPVPPPLLFLHTLCSPECWDGNPHAATTRAAAV